MAADLSTWLETHDDLLIRSASLELTQDEEMRRTVEIPIVAFFQGVQIWARKKDSGFLNRVLINWVESRSLVVSSETGSLLPVVSSIERVVVSKLRETLPPLQALALIVEIGTLFNDAMVYIAKLEADQVVASANEEVEKLQAALKRIDKSKSDFIAVAAHELKTPLTLIEGYMSMLRSGFQEPEHATLLLMLNGMQGGTARLREIIEDMIDVSLIDMKLLNLHLQPVWINRLVDIVGFDLQNVMQQRAIRLEIRKNEITERPTFADSERIYQVVQKILYNAVKYTPDGGTISIGARDLPGFTDLQISDTGIGIAPENLQRIFEKFSSQADVATHSSGKVKFKGGGPGLGLAIAKGIMEAHGGSIWAESPGYDEKTLPGSTFHIMIPMKSAPSDNPLSDLYKEGRGIASDGPRKPEDASSGKPASVEATKSIS